MIDPLILLALNMHASPGTYALLLGSGISRPAGIPTGWDVTLDLIRKLAAASDESVGGDPEAYYEMRFSGAPDYSAILAELAPGQKMRQSLLAGYFEPSDDDRAQGRKLPTSAHHAIARLIGRGYVRVVVTTNFDRLLEQALDAAGIQAVVISTEDQAKAAPPLAHSRCTVIKLHGDYRDSRILNTDAELAGYKPSRKRLLNQVLSEYALLISGWSGEYDTALKNAVEATANRRFPLFWASKGAPRPTGEEIVARRQGLIVTTTGADQLFKDLNARLDSLEALNRPEPLSTQMAVAQLKRALPDPVRRIELRDLVLGEANRAYDRLYDVKFLQEAAYKRNDLELGRVFVGSCRDLLPTIATVVGSGVHFDGGAHHALWLSALERLANPPEGVIPGSVHDLLMLPAVVLAYVMGVAGLSRGDWLPAASALARTRVRRDGRNDPLADALGGGSWFHFGFFSTSPNDDLAPSRWIREIARQALVDVLPDRRVFEYHCLQFEYLLCLVWMDSRLTAQSQPYMPLLLSLTRDNDAAVARIREEVLGLGSGWPVLAGDLFGAEAERVATAASKEFEIRESWWRGY